MLFLKFNKRKCCKKEDNKWSTEIIENLITLSTLLATALTSNH
jgi:hypothetical protein